MGSDIGPVKAVGPAPRMPAGLCRPAQNAWRLYWQDVLSGVARQSDGNLAIRWIKNVDRYHRLMNAADAEPMTRGSTGQSQANPMYALALKVEASIKVDEAQLGIGPLNRLRLGVALSEAGKSLSDLNAEAEVEGEDDEVDDPRAGFTVIDATS